VDSLGGVDLAHAEYERRLRLVRPDQWGLPTPCAEWTVRDLVNHSVAAARAYLLMLEGCSRERASDELASDALGDNDPVEAFSSSAAALHDALRKPGALDVVCAHPLGDWPGTLLIRLRATDVGVHAWDLARAIGADEHLHPRLVELALEFWLPNAESFRDLPVFAPYTGPVDESVPPERRLLHLAGRRDPSD